ncbi:hypothetical protein [Aliivibrio wodanis]|uniref:hypothetical protein n=1 Tax=Aliivibrio wodanis TaxID=80852 RepID=UPI00406C14EC
MIAYIVKFNRCSEEDAKQWADKHCGDWDDSPLPTAKTIIKKTTEKEDENE